MLETNISKLKGIMAEKGITQEQLATRIHLDSSTLSRKMTAKGLKFSIEEVHRIVKVLEIGQSDAADIFLHDDSHYCENKKQKQSN